MPVVTCDIRRGRSKERKLSYGKAISKAVSKATGAPIENILVIMNEGPGHNFIERGEALPDYEAGPDGQDVAAAKSIASWKT